MLYDNITYSIINRFVGINSDGYIIAPLPWRRTFLHIRSRMLVFIYVAGIISMILYQFWNVIFREGSMSWLELGVAALFYLFLTYGIAAIDRIWGRR